MSSDKKNKPEAGSEYKVDARGSLGLLALGDVGILAWREAKEKEKAKEDNDNKKKEE